MKEVFPSGLLGNALPTAAAICSLMVLGVASSPAQTPVAGPQPAALIPDDQLDSLVAPIALYPDPLLSQALVAATYPLEIIQLQQWMARNPGLKGNALANAVQQQPWDPSIQGMVAFPDVLGLLAGNIQWTTDLGNAFLAQQGDVMAAVQRMRAKAQGSGNLQSGPQQTVQTQSLDGGQQVIAIEPANPQVLYVPCYDPMVVFGVPAYPYPPFYCPGYFAGNALSFGAGVALGAAWGGCWGYNFAWGRGNVSVNYNNNYNRVAYNRGSAYGGNTYNNVNASTRNTAIANGNWQHNPQHRGGAPYAQPTTSARFASPQRTTAPATRPAVSSGSSYRPAAGGTTYHPATTPASRPSGANTIGHHSISSPSGGGAFGESARGGAAVRASSVRGATSYGGGNRGGVRR